MDGYHIREMVSSVSHCCSKLACFVTVKNILCFTYRMGINESG